MLGRIGVDSFFFSAAYGEVHLAVAREVQLADPRNARYRKNGFRVGIVVIERLGARWKKEWIVLAPNRQQRRLVPAEIILILLECRIKREAARVVEKLIQLDFVAAGTRQKRGVERVGFRRD